MTNGSLKSYERSGDPLHPVRQTPATFSRRRLEHVVCFRLIASFWRARGQSDHSPNPALLVSDRRAGVSRGADRRAFQHSQGGALRTARATEPRAVARVRLCNRSISIGFSHSPSLSLNLRACAATRMKALQTTPSNGSREGRATRQTSAHAPSFLPPIRTTPASAPRPPRPSSASLASVAPRGPRRSYPHAHLSSAALLAAALRRCAGRLMRTARHQRATRRARMITSIQRTSSCRAGHSASSR